MPGIPLSVNLYAIRYVNMCLSHIPSPHALSQEQNRFSHLGSVPERVPVSTVDDVQPEPLLPPRASLYQTHVQPERSPIACSQ